MTTQTKCSTPSCSNNAAAAGLCMGCYHYVYRAMKRGVRWTMERRDRVNLWVERLDLLASRSNVVRIKRSRRAA